MFICAVCIQNDIINNMRHDNHWVLVASLVFVCVQYIAPQTHESIAMRKTDHKQHTEKPQHFMDFVCYDWA